MHAIVWTPKNAGGRLGVSISAIDCIGFWSFGVSKTTTVMQKDNIRNFQRWWISIDYHFIKFNTYGMDIQGAALATSSY